MITKFLFFLGVYFSESVVRFRSRKTCHEQNNFRFGVLSFHIRRNVSNWVKYHGGNLGDIYQNFAVEYIYNQMGISTSELVHVNRDFIDVYDGKQVILPMNGFFTYDNPLVWSDQVTPVFIGFHLSKQSQVHSREAGCVNKMKKMKQAIGCRDMQTANFLRTQGVNAYFSSCLTLTFPKRVKEPELGKVFIVDVHEKCSKMIPNSLRNEANMNMHQDYIFNKTVVSEQEYLDIELKARNQLDLLKTQARLVITSRIHVAMPSIAMGIPVIFLTSTPNDVRYESFRGIIPVYNLNDDVDWNPKAPEIEFLKSILKENAIARIEEAAEMIMIKWNMTHSHKNAPAQTQIYTQKKSKKKRS